MATVVGTYSPNLFNSLPEVEDAHDTFNSRNGLPTLESSVQELFSRFNMNSRLGIALVHRHFPLAEDEVIVDVNGTSTAWRLTDAAVRAESSCFEKHGGYIKPQAWTVCNGQLIPYEFYFEHKHSALIEFEVDDLSIVDPGFLQEYIDLLHELDLTGTLGLRLLRKGRGRQIEFSERAANITFHIESGLPVDSDQTYIDTTWTYHGSPPKVQVAMSCVQSGNQHKKEG